MSGARVGAHQLAMTSWVRAGVTLGTTSAAGSASASDGVRVRLRPVVRECRRKSLGAAALSLSAPLPTELTRMEGIPDLLPLVTFRRMLWRWR